VSLRGGLVVALAALLVVCGGARTWRSVQRVPGIDFYQFWVIGHAVGRGDLATLYADDSRAAVGQEFFRRAGGPEGSERQRAAARMRQVLENYGTPFFYAALRPFGWNDYDASLDAFTAVSLAALAAAVLVFCRLAGHGASVGLLLLALAVHAFQPLSADVRVGNVNQLQLGMLAVVAWLAAGPSTWRQAAAGAVLGAAVLFKPTVALVAPVLLAGWAVTGRWARVSPLATGMAGGVLAAFCAGAAFFGSFGAWGEWLSVARAAPLAAMPVDFGNVSPSAVAEKWLGVSPRLVPGAAAAVAMALALWHRRSAPPVAADPRAADDILLIAGGCLLFLVSAPLVWQHYLILALPAVIVLLRPGYPRRQWLAIVAYVAIAIDPYADLFGITDPARQAPIVVAGIVLLFVLVVIEIATPRRAPELFNLAP
jgi:hypothetical protein